MTKRYVVQTAWEAGRPPGEIATGLQRLLEALMPSLPGWYLAAGPPAESKQYPVAATTSTADLLGLGWTAYPATRRSAELGHYSISLVNGEVEDDEASLIILGGAVTEAIQVFGRASLWVPRRLVADNTDTAIESLRFMTRAMHQSLSARWTVLGDAEMLQEDWDLTNLPRGVLIAIRDWTPTIKTSSHGLNRDELEDGSTLLELADWHPNWDWSEMVKKAPKIAIESRGRA